MVVKAHLPRVLVYGVSVWVLQVTGSGMTERPVEETVVHTKKTGGQSSNEAAPNNRRGSVDSVDGNGTPTRKKKVVIVKRLVKRKNGGDSSSLDKLSPWYSLS